MTTISESVGMNVHMGYPAYADANLVHRCLDNVGIRMVRDNSQRGAALLPGIDVATVIGNDATVGLIGPYVQSALSAGSKMIMGTNEINQIASWQTVYATRWDATVKAVAGAVPLVSPSIAYMGPAQLKDAQQAVTPGYFAAADYVDFHFYPGGRNPDDFLPLQKASLAVWKALDPTGSKPGIISESGFAMYPNTITASHPATSEADAALWVVNLIGSWLKVGASRLYLYALLDQPGAQARKDFNGWFGFFRADGTPKPVALALRWFMQAFGDYSLGDPALPGELAACQLELGKFRDKTSQAIALLGS